MCYYLLKHNDQVIVRSSVTVVTMSELETEDVKTKADILDKSITESIGDYNKSIVKGSFVEEDQMYTDVLNLENDSHDVVTCIDPKEKDQSGEDTPHDDFLDKYIGSKVNITCMGKEDIGLVVRRKRNWNGFPVGKSSSNPS